MGQPGAAGNLVSAVGGLAYANGQLWVADGSSQTGLYPQNNRVVAFGTSQIPSPYADLTNVTPWTPQCGLCGFYADAVLGQPDYLSSNPGTLQVAQPASSANNNTEEGSMNYPTAVATDGKYLVVADYNNNRVLIWNPVPPANSINTAPNLVLGQTNFTSANAGSGAAGMKGPEGVWIQNGVLFVADGQNSRVLIWKTMPTQNNQPADLVLGEPNFTTVVNPPEPLVPGSSFPAPTASSLLNPTSVTSDGKHLFVADLGNNRVLIWNTAFVNGQLNLSTGQAADVVVGQPVLTTSVPNWSGQMCGAADNSEPCASTLNWPRYVLSDGTRLFIADGGNDRVLIFNSIPTQNGASADEVLGQPNFTTDQVTSTAISITSTQIDNTSAVDVIPTPTSLAFDGLNLYVADPTNRRVLVFTPGDTPLPDASALNWASEIIRQEGFITFSLPSGGAIVANDTVSITIQGTTYTYTIVKTDTLDTIAQGIVKVINTSNSGAGDPNATAVFAGTGTGSVYLTSKGIDLAYDSISFSATTSDAVDIIATSEPQSGYLSAGDAGTGSAGMLIEIDGSNLSDNTQSAPMTGALPTSLGGVEVYMDGLPSPVLSVSPTQIVTEIPFNFTNGSDASAGTIGTSTIYDRNSTSIYVRTQHNDGSVTITNATPMYIAPANPGLFDAPAYAGQVRPWPVINAFHQPGNPNAVVSVDGSVTAGNTASITIGSATYTYTLTSTDTLLTVAQNLVNMINSAPDPNVTASLGTAFQRIILTAIQPGAAGTGIAISATSSASATVTLTAYTSSTCCDVVPNSLITNNNPAVPGELITLSATGLGTVQDINGNVLTVTTGQPWYGPAQNSAVSSVTATIAGQTAEVIGAGLNEAGYGIYGIQMIVPSGLSPSSSTQVYVAQNAFISNTATIPVGSPGIPAGAGLTTASLIVSPAALVLNGSTGAPTRSQTVTILNPNNILLSVSNISITGPNAGDFSFTPTCIGAVNPSCSFTVSFSPSTTGIETASLNISDNVDGNVQTVSLMGISGTVYQIANAQSGRVLDVTGGSKANGALVQQYQPLGVPNQQWSLVPLNNGNYIIMNVNSGLVLDVMGGSMANGTLIQQYQYLGNPNQQWTLTAIGNGFYSIINVQSGLALDDIGGAIQNGALVQQFQFVGDPNQQWSLIPPTQTYAITNLQTGSVLDVQGGSMNNGTLIQEYQPVGDPNQQWLFIPLDGTYYEIANLQSGLVLDVVGGNYANGAQIQQYEYLGDDNQKWALVPSGVDGYFSIVNKQTGRVLDIPSGNPANTTLIQQYDYLGGSNQLWTLVPTY